MSISSKAGPSGSALSRNLCESFSVFSFLRFFAWFFAFNLAWALNAAEAQSREDRFKGWDFLLEGSFVRNPDRQILRNFRLPESLEAERRIRKARDWIQSRDYAKAIDLLQQVIEENPDHVFQVAVDSLPGAKGCARFKRLCCSLVSLSKLAGSLPDNPS